jgi:hypothetical protein
MIIDASKPGLAAAAAAFMATFLACQAPAEAADVQQPVAAEYPDRWTFTVAPYLWGAGLNGDVGLFGREPVNVDMSFSDIFNNLRFGGMMVAELHNGTWGVFGDLIYVKTKSDESITRNILGVPTVLSASVETSSFAGTLMGEYRVYATESTSLDVLGGVRIWSVDNDINARLSTGGPRLASFSGSDGDTWVDPMVGAKVRFNTGTPWYFTAWGMVGGFGAGSEISWDVLGGVGYQWNQRLSTVAGYRALGVDYEHDGFVYDIVQHGPFLGVVMRF